MKKQIIKLIITLYALSIGHVTHTGLSDIYRALKNYSNTFNTFNKPRPNFNKPRHNFKSLNLQQLYELYSIYELYSKKSPQLLDQLKKQHQEALHVKETSAVHKKLIELGIDQKEAQKYELIYNKKTYAAGVDSIYKKLYLNQARFKPNSIQDLDSPNNHMILAHEAGHIKHNHRQKKCEHVCIFFNDLHKWYHTGNSELSPA